MLNKNQTLEVMNLVGTFNKLAEIDAKPKNVKEYAVHDIVDASPFRDEEVYLSITDEKWQKLHKRDTFCSNISELLEKKLSSGNPYFINEILM